MAAAALFFVAVSAIFQLPGLSRDGLLGRTTFFGGTLLERPGPMTRTTVLDFGSLDYTRYMEPYAAFVHKEFEAGRFPLWNPYIGGGVPIIETSPFPLLHPFTLLYAVLPSEQASSVLAVVRLAPAGLGAFLLARVLGCGVAPGALAGVLFMLSTYHLAFRFHPLPYVSALLPFMLVLSELVLRGASARRCGAGWALLGALALIGAHAETAVHVLGVAWSYHLLRAASVEKSQRWHSMRHALGFLGASSAFALLAACALVWGHLLTIMESNALRIRQSLVRPLPLVHLFSFIAPAFFFRPALYPAYIGVIPLLLAARGLVARGPFPAWPWVLIVGTALLVAYDVWPVAPVVHSLPLIGATNHRRLIFVIHLGLAMLAARGLAAPQSAALQRPTLICGAVIALSVAILWWTGTCPGPRTWLDFPTVLTIPVVFLGLGLVLLSPRVIRALRSGWIAVLTAVVFFELYAALGPRPRQDIAAFPPLPPTLRLVQGPPEAARVFIENSLLSQNVNMIYGIPTVAAYEPAMSRRAAELLGAAGLRPMLDFGMFADNAPGPDNLRLLNLLNVEYLVLTHPLEDQAVARRLEELTRTPVAVYRNPHAFPRAFVVDRARVADSPSAALRLLRDPRVDLRRVVVLEQPPPALSPGTGRRTIAARDTAEIRTYQPGAAHFAVSTSGGGYLVFSETYHTGWHATIDGKSAPVLRGNYNMIAIPLTAGTHDVRLRYRPRSLLVGGMISICTVLVLVGAVMLPPRRPEVP